MTDWDGLRAWLYKALSTEAILTEMESDGIALRAANDPAALQHVLPLEDFSHAIRSSAMAALPAYLALFCLENSARELISQRLSDQHGPDWWSTKAPAAVRTRVDGRKSKEGSNRWHVSRGASEIYYTDFGDLKLIVQSNWADFEDLFPHQNWLVTRLDELEASRNIIAHTNTLDDRELARLRLYLQDWTRQLG